MNKILDSDLLILKDLNWQNEVAKLEAQNFSLMAQLANERLQNGIIKTYLKYNLADNVKIDMKTGNLIFPQPDQIVVEDLELEKENDENK